MHVARFKGTGSSQTPHDLAQPLLFAQDAVDTRAEREAAGTPRCQGLLQSCVKACRGETPVEEMLSSVDDAPYA
jgi:hypothetical protein